MLYFCKRCNTTVEIPDISKEQRHKILLLAADQQQLQAIKMLREYTRCDLVKAKAFVLHINPTGRCHRCKFDALEGECVTCPKCGAFNLNWSFASIFDEDFCSKLEYTLTWALKNSTEENLKDFWCDGVLPVSYDTNHAVQSSDSQTVKFTTSAFLGKDGQEQYQLDIILGPASHAAFLKNEPIVAFIPSPEHTDWIAIDVKKKVAVVVLN